jgi:hypothetical protein
MTGLYYGSLAHQKSSGEGRHLAPLFREQRPHFGHAGSCRFDDNRALPVTPPFAIPTYSTERACPGAYEISGRAPTRVANEVNKRILRLNISRESVRRQKIDHHDRPETIEGHHADHNTDDIGPDQR